MNKILSIKAKKKFILILLALVIPAIPISLLLESVDYKSIVFTLVALFFIYKLFWMLFGQVDIESNDRSLVMSTSIAGINISRKKIDYNDIISVQVKKDSNDESFTGLGGFRVPDKIPYQILINTSTKFVEIGRGLESFDINVIVKELEKRKITIAYNC